MTLRSLVSVCTLLPLAAGAEESAQENAPDWLQDVDFSTEQIANDYEQSLVQKSAESDRPNMVRRILAGDLMMPVLVLAAAQEGVQPAPVVDTPEEQRIKELEMENARLKERLAKVEPFIDPDWPAQPERKQVRRFRVSRVLPGDLERAMQPKPSYGAISEHAVRFKPFSRAAMELPMWRPLTREEGRSHSLQNRFFWNATKALGAGLTSKEYRGIRLEVQRAMLQDELNAYYAVQYLADVVDVFKTYERMAHFGLVDGLAGPMSVEDFRKDPNTMFIWASEVNEQKRKLDLEDQVR